MNAIDRLKDVVQCNDSFLAKLGAFNMHFN